MTEARRQLHIFYRHVHVKAEAHSRDPGKLRPAWFSHAACWRNLLQTIAADPQGQHVQLHVMYDGTVEDLQTDFIAPYVVNQTLGLQLHLISAGSDKASSLITLAHVRGANLPPQDIVYFLENDYLHQHGWVSKVFELFNGQQAFDYVSLYDHKDKYLLPMYEGLQARLVISGSHHWRSTPSSCASYLVSKAGLDRDYDVLSAGKPDYLFFADLVEGRGRTLLSPIPGLSTHAMRGYLSPHVDWAGLAA
jgi:hypothetical protein